MENIRNKIREGLGENLTEDSGIKCAKISDANIPDMEYAETADHLASIKDIIYLDNQATTPVDPRVIEVLIDATRNFFGNPHSRSHAYGWTAEAMAEKARGQIAKLINAESKEIIFTSGATESNNTAIKGVAKFANQLGKNHIITLSTEHKCVIESCRSLVTEGYEITFLNPEKNGLLDLAKLEKAITSKTSLVSIMAVNNEIGVIQDLAAIGALCRSKGVAFHTDAAQAYGKIAIDVQAMNIDLLSISGHKIYGPKGIGALYIRRNGSPRIRLTPLMSGGGQEMGFRSGTLAMPLVMAFAKAAEICAAEMEKDYAHIKKLSDKLYNGINSALPEIILNGDKEKRYVGNMNLSFSFVEGESLIMAMSKLAVSSGSACTSSSLEPSYVLKALGLKDELAHSSIRFGIGRFTTEQEIDTAIEIVVKAVNKLRDMSPLWEMFKDNIDLDTIEWKEH